MPWGSKHGKTRPDRSTLLRCLAPLTAIALPLFGTACQGTGASAGQMAGTPIPAADTPEAASFRNQCSRCHSLPHPKRHNFAQWQHYLQLMDRRMEERGLAALEGEERQRVLEYLRTHSKGQPS